MNKMLCFCFLSAGMVLAGSATAQLPANPWDTVSFEKATVNSVGSDDGGVARISSKESASQDTYIPSIKYNPVNADAEAPKYVPAIDAQGNAKTGVTVKKVSTIKESSNAQGAESSASLAVAAAAPDATSGDWRGSGQFGKLNYTGEVTTYGIAYGQEMLAPEVNSHNLKVMLDHLRNLGYKIPESYNDKFGNFLSDYRDELREAYNGLGHQNNPFDTMFSGFLDVVEDGTGLDMENLLFNSIDLMSRE